MPKLKPFKEIIKDKIYEFEDKLSMESRSNCKIRAPYPIGQKHPNAKIKVTIEILKQ